MVRPSSSVWIIVARIALLLCAGAAAAAALVLRGESESGAGHAAASYVCPMHAEVRSAAAGDCPICKMALELVAPVAHAASLPTDAGSTSDAFVLPEKAKLFRFDDVAMAKNYIMSHEMRMPAWVESPERGAALLHTDQYLLLKPGEKALFSPSGPQQGSKHGIEVRVSAEPAVTWDAATKLVRFEIDRDAGLDSGRTGSIKLATRLRKGLVVKASAVRPSPAGPYVLVVAEDRRTLSRRPIEVGSVLYGYAAVISGLEPGEYVAAKHAFTLDAERRSGSAEP